MVAGLQHPTYLALYGTFISLWQLFGLGWLSMIVSFTLEMFKRRATGATNKIDKIAKRHVRIFFFFNQIFQLQKSLVHFRRQGFGTKLYQNCVPLEHDAKVKTFTLPQMLEG